MNCCKTNIKLSIKELKESLNKVTKLWKSDGNEFKMKYISKYNRFYFKNTKISTIAFPKLKKKMYNENDLYINIFLVLLKLKEKKSCEQRLLLVFC
jgi:hypothetical protein